MNSIQLNLSLYNLGNITITDLDVPGFHYLTASVPVNPLTPSSLAKATYIGRLCSPYPPLETSGIYNISIERIVLGKGISIPFGGISLAYRVEVDPIYLRVVKRYFHGCIEKPLFIEVTGNYDAIQCLLDLSGKASEASENVDVAATLVLEYCDNCSKICSAQAVKFSISLGQPWMIRLNGSYMLENNVTTVSAGGATKIQGIDLDVYSIIESSMNQFSIKELQLVLHMPYPFNFALNGTYSKPTGIAAFSGSLSTEIIDLSVSLTADIAREKISAIEFSGFLSKPFTVKVKGAYKLSASNTSHLVLSGKIEVEEFLNLSLTTQLQLSSRSLSMYALYASIPAPLESNVSAHYKSLDSDTVDMEGSIKLAEGQSAMVKTRINISSHSVAIIDYIEISGVFPHPLQSLSYNGLYSRQCSCAEVSGSIVQDEFLLHLSTTLNFVSGELAAIETLNVSIEFYRPLSLHLNGFYVYSNTSTTVVYVNGSFFIPHLTLNAMVVALIEGVSSVEVLKFHFAGTFSPPLHQLTVTGDIENESRELVLVGSLKLPYATFNTSTTYSFYDDLHNQSAMISDVRLNGYLSKPFELKIYGHYIFADSNFMVGGTINVSQFVELAVSLLINTSYGSPQLDVIHISGHISTPIPFQTSFKGIYNNKTRSATLSSTVFLDKITLRANANLVYMPTNSFELQSIQIEGMLDSPLAINVTGVYTPSNNQEIELVGHVEIDDVSFTSTVYAYAVNADDALMIKKVLFEGTVYTPFMLKLKGCYRSGETLLLRTNLEFSDLTFSATALVNLTSVPRQITSYAFKGRLLPPFNSSLSAVYSSGELVLRGVMDLASLHFEVNVMFENSPNLTVKDVVFQTEYNPLNLKLTATYNRQENAMNLIGCINITTPPVIVAVTSFIDLNSDTKDTKILSDFNLAIKFTNPPLHITGMYRRNSKKVELFGSLPIGPLKLQAHSVIRLGNLTTLEEISLSVNYTIPFGRNLLFVLAGNYNTKHNSLFFLEGSITEGSSNELVSSLLVLSNTASPTIRVVSLYFQEINIGTLLNRYLKISWPSHSLPLIFKNVAVYKSEDDLEYEMVPYKVGFHARGEVKILFLPSFTIDASMIDMPHKRFEVSYTLHKVVDWSVIVLCNTEDSGCDKNGPKLAIKYEPDNDIKSFQVSGGLKLFGVRIGNIDLTVLDVYSKATLTLSDSLKNMFHGILPEEITVSWSEDGFHTNLKIPELEIPDFKFQDVSSPSICQALKGYIQEIAIDVPFDLRSTLVIRLLQNGSISFGAAIEGKVQIEIAEETVHSLKINFFVIEIILFPGEVCTWQCFVKAIKEGLTKAGPRIVEDLLNDPGVVAALVAKEGQAVIGDAAASVCDEALNVAAEAAASAASAAAAAGSTAAAAGAASVSAFACKAAKIFGGCKEKNDGGGGGNNAAEIDNILSMFRQKCDRNSLCSQNCSDKDGKIECSCYDGYYLSSNGYSCIRKYYVTLKVLKKFIIMKLLKATIDVKVKIRARKMLFAWILCLTTKSPASVTKDIKEMDILV